MALIARWWNGQRDRVARFHAEEEANDPKFSKQLAGLADYYVNDAFGTAHRAHASTVGITKFVQKSAAGLLMEKEIVVIGSALEDPKRPFVAIVGGAKVSSKLAVLENLIVRVDRLLIGADRRPQQRAVSGLVVPIGALDGNLYAGRAFNREAEASFAGSFGGVGDPDQLAAGPLSAWHHHYKMILIPMQDAR